MLFRSLRLQGFKKYRDQIFVFNPGLNVFKGPNEVGKTTLHQGLITALYGLGAKSSGLLKKDVQSWAGMSLCRVQLDYFYGDEAWQISRDLVEGRVQISRFDSKEKSFVLVSEDTKKVNETIATQLGIYNPIAFNYTISVRQRDLIALENLNEISQAIERVFTGTDAMTPDLISKNLNGMRKKLKKSRNESPGEIDTLEQTLATITREITDSAVHDQERMTLLKEQALLEGKLPAMEQDLETTTQLLDRYAVKTTRKKAYQELIRQRDALARQSQGYERANQTIHDLQNDLAKFGGLLVHQDRIADFTYLRQRLQELDETIARFMGQKPEDSTITPEQVMKKEDTSQKFLTFLPPLLILGVLGTILGIFLDLPVLLYGSGALSFLVIAVFLASYLRIGSNSPRPTAHFRTLLDERTAQATKIAEIMTLWGYTAESSLESVNRKIQTLERLQQSIAKQEASCDGFLAGGDKDALDKEHHLVERKLSQLSEQMDEMEDFAPTHEETAKWANKKSILQKEIPEHRDRLHHIEGRLHELRKIQGKTETLEEQKAYYTQALHDAQYMLDAVAIAQTTFDDVIGNYQSLYLPQLEKKASGYFRMMTQERYSAVDLSSWPQMVVRSSRPIGSTISAYSLGQNLGTAEAKSPAITPPALSQGTMDQLYFSLRLAASALMSKDAALPLLLDDPFVHYDQSRLQETLSILIHLAQAHQILFFTHSEQVPSILQSLPIQGVQIALTDMV